MKFRWKLTLSYLLLILLLTGAYYISFDRNAQTYFLKESREHLISQTRLAGLLAERENDALSPQRLAEKIGAVVHARVTLIDRSGAVMGDSDLRRANSHELENHLQRPEIQQALRTGSGSAIRYSKTLKISMLYTASTYETNEQVALIRLALPLKNLENAAASLRRMTAGTVSGTILLALIFSAFLSKITSRPLQEMAKLAARIGKTEERIIIPVVSRDEIGSLATVLNDMSERIDIQMQSLSTEKTRLDAILRGMGEGVALISRDGIITLVNPAFLGMFEVDETVKGKNLIEISRNPDILAAFYNVIASREKLVHEIKLLSGNRTLLANWTPLSLAGERDCIVAVFHDITAMKRMEEMRSDFVANVSHELRTPVSVIKGYAETILQNDMLYSNQEQACRFVEIIYRHSERLTTLINDILTLSSLEAEKTKLDLHPMDIVGTIIKSRNLLSSEAASKNITLATAIADGLPKALADQGRLEQVLVNLIDNAIKYTPDGGEISITADAIDSAIRISVRDTGVGIPSKDLSRIFERFYRVDEGRSRERGGTGLGLAIAKHIVQLHGGDLSVTSVPEKGSVFSFTLRTA